MKIKIATFLLLFFGAYLQAEASYDIVKVRDSWMSFINYERSVSGTKDLQLNETLNNTATSWCETSQKKGYIDHKRPGQKAYYDYNKINSRFANKGVSFQKIQTTTFSESIGRNVFNCKKDDCTADLIEATKSTFYMYMREKGKKYAPHYNSMINRNFSQVGIGVVVDQTKKRYYLTIHYSTNLK